MSEAVAIVTDTQSPDQFRGIYERLSAKYRPLFDEARATLRALPVPEVIRENFSFGVVEHPQPAFMLLPLMHLALADHRGGITAAHRAYLPYEILTMELIALFDDTVDYTPLRSKRPTYPARYGAASAASFSGYVYSVLVERTQALAPAVLPQLTNLFTHLCSLEVWEHQSRYPEVSVASLSRWVRNRYDAVHPVLAYSMDSALTLLGERPIPYEFHVAFGDLQQDVDDLVNIIEERERLGENDDLKLGIVSYPLLATVRRAPEAAALLESVWAPYREVPIGPRDRHSEALARCDAQTQPQYDALVALVKKHGVPATIDKMLADTDAALAALPDDLRPCLGDIVVSFLDRHRGLDPRASREAWTRRAADNDPAYSMDDDTGVRVRPPAGRGR